MTMKLVEMIGLPILDIEVGKRLGHVQDFYINDHWELEGIELESRKIFSSTVRFVPWHEVVAYGEDAIMIRNKNVVQKKNAIELQHTLMCGDRKLRDLPLVTPEGNQIGRLVDVCFDPKMGNTLIGLEITDGFISDLIDGRKWLRVTDMLKIGQDAIMVPVDSEQCLEKIITSANG